MDNQWDDTNVSTTSDDLVRSGAFDLAKLDEENKLKEGDTRLPTPPGTSPPNLPSNSVPGTAAPAETAHQFNLPPQQEDCSLPFGSALPPPLPPPSQQLNLPPHQGYSSFPFNSAAPLVQPQLNFPSRQGDQGPHVSAPGPAISAAERAQAHLYRNYGPRAAASIRALGPPVLQPQLNLPVQRVDSSLKEKQLARRSLIKSLTLSKLPEFDADIALKSAPGWYLGARRQQQRDEPQLNLGPVPRYLPLVEPLEVPSSVEDYKVRRWLQHYYLTVAAEEREAAAAAAAAALDVVQDHDSEVSGASLIQHPIPSVNHPDSQGQSGMESPAPFFPAQSTSENLPNLQGQSGLMTYPQPQAISQNLHDIQTHSGLAPQPQYFQSEFSLQSLSTHQGQSEMEVPAANFNFPATQNHPKSQGQFEMGPPATYLQAQSGSLNFQPQQAHSNMDRPASNVQVQQAHSIDQPTSNPPYPQGHSEAQPVYTELPNRRATSETSSPRKKRDIEQKKAQPSKGSAEKEKEPASMNDPPTGGQSRPSAGESKFSFAAWPREANAGRYPEMPSRSRQSPSDMRTMSSGITGMAPPSRSRQSFSNMGTMNTGMVYGPSPLSFQSSSGMGTMSSGIAGMTSRAFQSSSNIWTINPGVNGSQPPSSFSSLAATYSEMNGPSQPSQSPSNQGTMNAGIAPPSLQSPSTTSTTNFGMNSSRPPASEATTRLSMWGLAHLLQPPPSAMRPLPRNAGARASGDNGVSRSSSQSSSNTRISSSGATSNSHSRSTSQTSLTSQPSRSSSDRRIHNHAPHPPCPLNPHTNAPAPHPGFTPLHNYRADLQSPLNATVALPPPPPGPEWNDPFVPNIWRNAHATRWAMERSCAMEAVPTIDPSVISRGWYNADDISLGFDSRGDVGLDSHLQARNMLGDGGGLGFGSMPAPVPAPAPVQAAGDAALARQGWGNKRRRLDGDDAEDKDYILSKER